MLKKDLGKKRSGSTHHDGGRHQDEQMNSNFTLFIKWFEAEAGAELYTLTELHSKMIKLADGSDVYNKKRLKQKLQERYTNYIFFANVEGREDCDLF